MTPEQIRRTILRVYRPEFRDIGDDIATWDIRDGRIVISLDKRYFDLSFERLSVADLNKNYLDPYYGTLPHEITEATLTSSLISDGLKETIRKFPNYAVQLKAEAAEIEQVLKTTDREQLLDDLGGIMHDVIVNSGPGDYDDWIDYIDGFVEEA